MLLRLSGTEPLLRIYVGRPKEAALDAEVDGGEASQWVLPD